MNILALDLGTKTGWASRWAGRLNAGTWNFEQKKGPCCAVDPRLICFRHRLEESGDTFDLLAYEDVQFMRGRAQAFLWSGFRTVLWLFAHDHKIPIICCPVKTLKKYATGNGNSDKDAMALAYYEKVQVGGLVTSVENFANPGSALDDNAIDAWHLLHWAESQPLTNPKNSTP
jgi:hypothetical protein